MKNGLIFATDIINNTALLTQFSGANIVCSNENALAQIENILCGYSGEDFILFQYVDDETEIFFADNLYISTIELSDDKIDSIIEHYYNRKGEFLIDCARDLQQVGEFDAKMQKSPIMYLHSLGILDNSGIVGGIYLDKDDVDLMTQSNAHLVLTPSHDASVGNGIPPLKLYKSRELKMHVGTICNELNPSKSLKYECEVLTLLVNGSMCEKIFTVEEIAAFMK